MAITEKLKGFIGGVFASTGTWMLAINLRAYLLEVSPITNQYILGVLLIIIGGYISSSRLNKFFRRIIKK